MGRTAALDVFVTSPFHPQTLLEAGVTATAAALATEARKHQENNPKCSELAWVCIHVVAESYVAWSKEATQLFSTIASRIATPSSKPKSVTMNEIYGRLNLQLVRANATSILTRLIVVVLSVCRCYDMYVLFNNVIVAKQNNDHIILSVGQFSLSELFISNILH